MQQTFFFFLELLLQLLLLVSKVKVLWHSFLVETFVERNDRHQPFPPGLFFSSAVWDRLKVLSPVTGHPVVLL